METHISANDISKNPLFFAIDANEVIIFNSVENYCKISHRQIVKAIRDAAKNEEYNFEIGWLNLNVFIEDIYRKKFWKVSFHASNRTFNEAYYVFQNLN